MKAIVKPYQPLSSTNTFQNTTSRREGGRRRVAFFANMDVHYKLLFMFGATTSMLNCFFGSYFGQGSPYTNNGMGSVFALRAFLLAQNRYFYGGGASLTRKNDFQLGHCTAANFYGQLMFCVVSQTSSPVGL